MNGSQLPYGLGSQNARTKYISKHNRIMFSHWDDVSQFPAAAPCITSLFLVKILWLKQGRYFCLFHISGQEMSSRVMKGTVQTHTAVVGCAGLWAHSACVPLCHVSSLPPLVMEHLLGQFPMWAFYWEVQNSQCRLNTKLWYCFHDSVSVTFQKAHPLSRRKKSYLFLIYCLLNFFSYFNSLS